MAISCHRWLSGGASRRRQLRSSLTSVATSSLSVQRTELTVGGGVSSTASWIFRPGLRMEPPEPGGSAAIHSARRGGGMPDELHSRHLLVRVAEIAAIIALVAIAISALPGLDEVRARLQNATPGWIVALALAEIGSCAGYLLVFRSTFCSQMPWAL